MGTAEPHLFVSADIEGTSGYVDPAEDDTPAVAAAMVGDVDAAVEGALEARPGLPVTVADAHGDKRTIPPAELHGAADLVRGGPRPDGMVEGSAGAELAFLVGYHDRPGSGGHLEHTFSGALADVRLDGTSVGEVGLNATLLADRGVPTALVSGDDRLEATVADRLPDAEFVRTKTARGARAATCRPAGAVRADLREAAAAAVADPPAPTPPAGVSTSPPVRTAVEYDSATRADVATLWPGVERGGDSRTVVHGAPDVETAYRFVRGAATVPRP